MTFHKRPAALAILAASALACAAPAAARTCRPTTTALPALPGGDFSEVVAFGPDGLVGGDSAAGADDQHAVLWRNGAISDTGIPHSYVADIDRWSDVLINATDYDGPDSHAYLVVSGVRRELQGIGGDFIYARRMNDRRDVVGGGNDPSGKEHALVWRGGSVTPTQLPTPTGFDDAELTGINQRGDIAGNVYDEADDISAAAVWHANGRVEVLPYAPFQGDRGYGVAHDIDALGVVAGDSGPNDIPGRIATLWIGRHQRRIGQFLDGGTSVFYGAAPAGIYVGGGTYSGTLQDGAVFHAALSLAGVGRLRTLMPLSGDARDESQLLTAIFDNGDATVGGFSATGEPGQVRATIWTCAVRQSFVPSRSLLGPKAATRARAAVAAVRLRSSAELTLPAVRR